MFTIIGGDGREYGPATAQQIRTWIASGRANLDTKARVLGSEEWRRLGDFVEFSSPDEPPPMAAPPITASAAGTVPALAGRGGRIGGALFNAFFYCIATTPGSMVMSTRMLKDNPQMLQGDLFHLNGLNMAGAFAARSLVWAGFGVAVAVQLILLGTRGQNLGKLIAGNRIVTASDGGPAGFVRAGLLRFIVPLLIIYVLNQILLGWLFLLVDFCFIFREDRRCLHDLIAGTKVVPART